MLTKINRAFLILLLALLGSCASDPESDCNLIAIEQHLEDINITEFKTTDSGLVYIIEEGSADPIPPQRVINCVIKGFTLDGVQWADTDPNNPYPILVGDRVVLPGIEEALTLMRLDESGIFYLPPSLAFGDEGSAPEICPGESVRIDILSTTVKQNLVEYIAENEITGLDQTSSGLYFKETVPGEGDLPANGSIVSMSYKGYLLNGTEFDASDFFDFTVGAGNVIPGFDEGVKRFRSGGSGIIYIPYDLAYGASGTVTGIGGYEDLIFEISIIDIN